MKNVFTTCKHTGSFIRVGCLNLSVINMSVHSRCLYKYVSWRKQQLSHILGLLHQGFVVRNPELDLLFSLYVQSTIIIQTVSFIKIGPKHHSSIMIMFFVAEATISLFILDFIVTQPMDLKGILKTFIPLCGFKNVSGRFDSPNIKNDFYQIFVIPCCLEYVTAKKGTTASD